MPSIDDRTFFPNMCVCCPLSGNYVSMDMSGLPPFWLAYLSDPSDSGRIHSNIRQRWLSGTSSYQTLHRLPVIHEAKGQIWYLEKGDDDVIFFQDASVTLSLCHSVHHFAGQKVHLSTEISQHLPKSAETQSCLTTSLLTLWCMICRLLMVFTLKLEQLEGVKGIWPHWQLLL